ncbi:hypothetical protein AXZ77_3086 [Thioclava sp. ES.031]|uniref:hypothetical protein n=1 Tax=Thioclava sp. ES.031 TaxID=1798203 RepID=UPI000BF57DB2|nr:hypothetical protein [Thioclava sp. ES.031]PFG64446.1 hypothetical protein AXZ77_3086 [Thioclava sp. ES.031]
MTRHIMLPALLASLALLAACQEMAPKQDGAMPTTLPDGMIGRWGLTKADCDSSRDDAKGLMVVKPDSLQFYESQAKLTEIDSATDRVVRATWNFIGEGEKWQRDIVLTLSSTGIYLSRQDITRDSMKPLTYRQCVSP